MLFAVLFRTYYVPLKGTRRIIGTKNTKTFIYTSGSTAHTMTASTVDNLIKDPVCKSRCHCALGIVVFISEDFLGFCTPNSCGATKKNAPRGRHYPTLPREIFTVSFCCLCKEKQGKYTKAMYIRSTSVYSVLEPGTREDSIIIATRCP